MKFYKVTGPNGEAIHGGSGKWPLPNGKKPGSWTKKQKPELCVSGWHLIPAHALGSLWQNGATLWEAEGRGESSESNNKSAYSSGRLIRRIGVLTPKARKAYVEAVAPARKAYDEAVAPARKAYVEAVAPALKAYDEAVAPARKAYDEACEVAIEKIFGGAL